MEFLDEGESRAAVIRLADHLEVVLRGECHREALPDLDFVVHQYKPDS
jgi:hypothetical protein